MVEVESEASRKEGREGIERDVQNHKEERGGVWLAPRPALKSGIGYGDSPGEFQCTRCVVSFPMH